MEEKLINKVATKQKNGSNKLFLFFSLMVIVFGLIIYLISFANLTNFHYFQPTCYQPNFDYYYFVQRWPPTECYHNSQCFANVTNTWQIHGLWPNYKNNTWPQFCCVEDKFNLTELNPIYKQLTLYWRNLIKDDSVESLWDHEWTKHGTCARCDFHRQLDYFNSTLNAYEKFNLMKIFAENNLIPNDKVNYDKNKFRSVLFNQFNINVHLQCVKKHKKYFLDSVYICMNKTDLKLINCTEPDSCKDKIYYPTSTIDL